MIKIKVEKKIATNLTPFEKIVCGNEDYEIEFEFDEQWEGKDAKIALFAYNENEPPIAQPFKGNICPVPPLENTTVCAVGVKTDNGRLSTTTPAYVFCLKCISDKGAAIPPPPKGLWDKIIELINAGMLKGEKGDPGKKGEKGDAGAIKFVTVVALPTENIDESTIYLVPIENPDGENRFTEYAYIDGKWETLGAISIQFDPSEYVKFDDRDNFVKEGLTDNTETWTDEDKAKACETIGAFRKYDGGKDNMLYGAYWSGSQQFFRFDEKPTQVSFPRRTTTGGLRVAIDETDENVDELATPKKYVDTLIAELRAETWTDEDKAKVCEWIGAVVKNEITALMEGKFVIATFDIIKDGPKEITLQNLTGMTKIDWGDGTVNNELTHSYKYNQDEAVNGVCKYTCKIYDVTSIGDEAFNNCSRLSSVVIGDSVTSIGECAFNLCERLSSVVIGDSVTSIGDYAFCECYRLTSVVIGDSVASIGDHAFLLCGMTSVVIPDSVTSIGYQAFYLCGGLTSVTIGNNVTSIGQYAFSDCNSLTSVEFKSITPTKISTHTFSGAPLATIYVPNGTSEDYKTKWTENGVTEDVLQLIVEVESDRVAMLSDIKKLYEKLGL